VNGQQKGDISSNHKARKVQVKRRTKRGETLKKYAQQEYISKKTANSDFRAKKNGKTFVSVLPSVYRLTTPKVGKIAKYSQVIEQKVRQNQK
jgi:hypothetical protein